MHHQLAELEQVTEEHPGDAEGQPAERGQLGDRSLCECNLLARFAKDRRARLLRSGTLARLRQRQRVLGLAPPEVLGDPAQDS